ncbi:MAG: hypothetical protein EBQ49_07140 [Verrucomicrobia bacterium]|nr:hypothetical protein [Verrucomicrobiota bacterium]
MYSFFRVFIWIIFICGCFLVFGNPDVFGKYPAHVKLIGLSLIFAPLLILKGIIATFSETKTPTISKIEPTVAQPASVLPKTESLDSSLSSLKIEPKIEPIVTKSPKII